MMYPWLRPVWQYWQNLLRQDRMPHATLLTAELGCGAEVLSAYLAKTVLCVNSDTEACGICHSCQLIDSGNHPDLHVIRPEQAGKQIGIDAIRQVTGQAMASSQLGGKRVIVIEQADSLGEAAANALLKTLEEPPVQCHFILTSSSLDGLLPTIVSRCSKWHIHRPSEIECKDWLIEQKIDSSLITTQAIRLNNCAPLQVLAFLEQEGAQQHLSLLSDFLTFIHPPHLGLFDTVNQCEKSGSVALIWLCYALMDALKCQQGITVNWVHCDQSATDIQRLSLLIPTERLIQQINHINRLRQRLDQHSGLNRELLIIEWLTDFMEGAERVY